jgi:hypothetical protein
MQRTGLAVVVSLISALPAGAQEFADVLNGVPPEIATSAAAYLEECRSFGTTVSPTADFITTVDLNDDNALDYVIDTDEINAPCFCGSGGCTIEAWVSAGGGYSKAFESNVREWQVSPKDTLPPLLLVDLHGSACGGVGADLCLKALVYQDGKLIDTTAGQ